MQKIKIIILAFIFTFVSLGNVYAKKASLILFPTILELTDKDRRATIKVINKGDARGLYRLSLIDTDMKENGTLLHLDEDEARDFSLKPIVRMAPRRMILEAGQSQRVRIIVRKPDGLESGEYRSHLKVKLLEDNVDKKGRPIVEKRESSGLALVPKARHVTAIPIFVRFGEIPKFQASISGTKFSNENNVPTVSLGINRESSMTIRGDIRIYYIDESGKSTMVKFFPGVPVYNPSSVRNMSLPLEVPDGLSITDKGSFHITYSQLEKQGGDLIAETTFSP